MFAAVVPIVIAAATSPVAAQALPSPAKPLAAPLPASVDRLIGEARARRLSESRDWQVLLHYRRTSFGGWKSEADGDGFFLAGREGRRDPAKELDAALKAFLAAAPAGDEHPQCKFPARWDWLKRVLAIDARAVPDQPCPTFDIWRTGISAGAVTLVYATAFLNSPASMYGHTFFRLSRTTAEGNRLLDYIVNFAADVDTNNGLVFAWKGVTGGFPGRFYILPYYVKVQEYSNIESRDLWEYQLALSPQQVRRLVMHAWETRSTHFDYFFFTRNCSYYLLTLLEAAAPELHLIDEFPGHVIPSDTVRVVLKQPGLVVRTTPWPSLLSVMQRRKAELTRRELKAAEAWVLDPAVETSGRPQLLAAETLALSKERQALVIDAAFDYLRYRDGLRAEPSDAFKRRERRMLVARGRLGVPPQELVVRPMVGAPEQGHDTLRLAVGGGVADQSGPFQTLSVRGAIHDLLDPGRGYPADSRLQMGELRLRFDDRPRRFSLDHFDAVDILSASALDRWVHTVSWKVWVGADNARELGCAREGSDRAGWRCLYGGVITGGGVALRFGPGGRLLLSMLAETDLGVGPAFAAHDDFRTGGGGEATLSGGAGARWRFEAGARYIYYFLGARGGVLRGRVAQGVMLSRMLGLRLAAETSGDFAQLGAEALAYF